VNPDVSLPNLPIEPIHRYDPSGTSFAFTSYLSAVSPEWKSSVGTGTKVNWPAGRSRPRCTSGGRHTSGSTSSTASA
jgi:phosphate transport system substrate-binding protein